MQALSQRLLSLHIVLSFALQEKLLLKCSSQYHAKMKIKINFADNQHKFDPRTTSALYIVNNRL